MWPIQANLPHSSSVSPFMIQFSSFPSLVFKSPFPSSEFITARTNSHRLCTWIYLQPFFWWALYICIYALYFFCQFWNFLFCNGLFRLPYSTTRILLYVMLFIFASDSLSTSLAACLAQSTI